MITASRKDILLHLRPRQWLLRLRLPREVVKASVPPAGDQEKRDQ